MEAEITVRLMQGQQRPLAALLSAPRSQLRPPPLLQRTAPPDRLSVIGSPLSQSKSPLPWKAGLCLNSR